MLAMACSCWPDVAMSRSRNAMPRVMAGLGQFDARGGPHELVGHAHQDARTITGVLLGAHGATVVEIDEHFDGVVDDLTFRPLVECGDHTYAASVMF